ncbi:MAG: hypothetical protein NUW37_07440 [Planctomycetes bacterium]|nr:hypothetical protein [Planctomycetota bacterium]
MVYVPTSGAGAAAAAAQQAQLQNEEEEILTGYNSQDLQGDFQFKIVRGDYRTAEKIRDMLSKQAAYGWQFLEKFDNTRIRLKRKAPSNMDYEDDEAYATKHGSTADEKVGIAVLIAVLAGSLAVGLIAFFIAN